MEMQVEAKVAEDMQVEVIAGITAEQITRNGTQTLRQRQRHIDIQPDVHTHTYLCVCACVCLCIFI